MIYIVLFSRWATFVPLASAVVASKQTTTQLRWIDVIIKTRLNKTNKTQFTKHFTSTWSSWVFSTSNWGRGTSVRFTAMLVTQWLVTSVDCFRVSFISLKHRPLWLRKEVHGYVFNSRQVLFIRPLAKSDRTKNWHIPRKTDSSFSLLTWSIQIYWYLSIFQKQEYLHFYSFSLKWNL